MSKKTKKAGKQQLRTGQRPATEAVWKRRNTFLLWGLVATFVLVAVGGISFLLSTGSSSSSGERPYVGGDLHSLAVDPVDPERVMVGGHDGGAISDDGGKTWRQASDLKGADPMGWVINPDDTQKMYIGGHPGFYRSEDGGESWSKDNSGLPGTDVHGLGIDPENPDVLYAYIVERGLYRSRDAGESWKRVKAEAGVMGPILVDPRDSNALYVSSMKGGFRKSADSGETWQTVGPLPGDMVMSISQNWQEPDTFYAASGGVFKSTDGGKSWRRVSDGLPGNVSAVAVAQNDPQIVYAGVLEGTEARVFRSEDGGESWQAQN